MKIRTVGARVVPEGQTDMTKLILALRIYANAPKNESCGEYDDRVWTTFICLRAVTTNDSRVPSVRTNFGEWVVFTFLRSPLLYCVGAKAEKTIKTRKQRRSGAAIGRRGWGEQDKKIRPTKRGEKRRTTICRNQEVRRDVSSKRESKTVKSIRHM